MKVDMILAVPLTIIYAILEKKESFRSQFPRRGILTKVWSKKATIVSGHPRGAMMKG